MLANTFVRSSRRVVPASRTTLRLRGTRPASTLAENPHIVILLALYHMVSTLTQECYSTYTEIHLIQANNCYHFSPRNHQHLNSQSAPARLCRPHRAILPKTPSFCRYCTRCLRRMRRRIPTFSRKQLFTRRPVAPICRSRMMVQAGQITREVWGEGDTEGGYM